MADTRFRIGPDFSEPKFRMIPHTETRGLADITHNQDGSITQKISYHFHNKEMSRILPGIKGKKNEEKNANPEKPALQRDKNNNIILEDRKLDSDTNIKNDTTMKNK